MTVADPFCSLLGAHRGAALPDGDQLALGHPGPAAAPQMDRLEKLCASGRLDDPLRVLSKHRACIADRPLLDWTLRKAADALTAKAAAEWKRHSAPLLRAAGAVPEFSSWLVAVPAPDRYPTLAHDPGWDVCVCAEPWPAFDSDPDIERVTHCGTGFYAEEARRLAPGSWASPPGENKVCRSCARAAADLGLDMQSRGWTPGGTLSHPRQAAKLQPAVLAAVRAALEDGPLTPQAGVELAVKAIAASALALVSRDLAEVAADVLVAELGANAARRAWASHADELSDTSTWTAPARALLGDAPELLDAAEVARRAKAFRATVRALTT